LIHHLSHPATQKSIASHLPPSRPTEGENAKQYLDGKMDEYMNAADTGAMQAETEPEKTE
jgi:hypothetical protein